LAFLLQRRAVLLDQAFLNLGRAERLRRPIFVGALAGYREQRKGAQRGPQRPT
jgi:hypothetical protein